MTRRTLVSALIGLLSVAGIALLYIAGEVYASPPRPTAAATGPVTYTADEVDKIADGAYWSGYYAACRELARLDEGMCEAEVAGR